MTAKQRTAFVFIQQNCLHVLLLAADRERRSRAGNEVGRTQERRNTNGERWREKRGSFVFSATDSQRDERLMNSHTSERREVGGGPAQDIYFKYLSCSQEDEGRSTDFTRRSTVLQQLSRFPWKRQLPVRASLAISDSYSQPPPQLTSRSVRILCLIFPVMNTSTSTAACVSAQEQQET